MLYCGKLMFIFSLVIFFSWTDTALSNSHETCTAPSSRSGRTVLVTGANGYIASWIVKLLLDLEYFVHACVRDATNPTKVNHLRDLPNADRFLKIYSTGNLGSDDDCDSGTCFDEAMDGCDTVFHVSMAMDWDNGEDGMYKPTLVGTQHLLDSMKRNTNTVRSLVLTSSMAAVSVRGGGYLIDESQWRDEDVDKAAGSWYSATKIAQEKLVQHWVNEEKQRGSISSNFKLISICPTRVIGPPISGVDAIPGWLSALGSWMSGEITQSPNDSIQFVHVEDCARMHVQAMEMESANGRYLCVDESWHWNDMLLLLKQFYPNMHDINLYNEADKSAPLKFRNEKMKELGVRFRPMSQIFQESVSYLKQEGVLQ